MRAGLFAALFLSGFAAVQAAPSALQQRQNLANNIESAADDLFSINIGSILSEATPVVGSLIQDATSLFGVVATDTALQAAATSLIGDAASALGPVATGIESAVTKANGAAQTSVVIARPLTMGAAAVLGSMFLGAYAVL